MEKTRMFACTGIADSNPAITYYPMANSDNGFDRFEVGCVTIEQGGGSSWQAFDKQEYMQLVLEGSIRVSNRQGQYFDMGPGEAILIAPGEEFEMVNTAAGQSKYMIIKA